MNAFELSDLDRQRVQGGKLYLEFLRGPTLSVGLYVLYVVTGRATVRVGDEDREVQAGSVIFVPPGVPHRFHSITEELRILVFFAPAEGTASDGGA